MFFFIYCAFVGFAVTSGGWVMFATFGAHFVETSAFRCMVSQLLTFTALNELEIEVIFLRRELLLMDVDSMLDAFIGRVCAGNEHYEGEVASIVFKLSSQCFHSYYLESASLILEF
jgi:hypothetical protein